MGRIASGKSTVAQQLANELGWPVFSSDELRKTLVGVPLTIRTTPELRAKVYSNRTTEQTYEQLLEKGLAALAAHNGVVLDATFSSREKRDVLREKCVKAGLRLQVIELEANLEEIVKRLKAREESTAEISDARLENLEKLSAAYEPPTELGELIKVSTSNGVLDTVKAVLLHLAENQSAAIKAAPVPQLFPAVH